MRTTKRALVVLTLAAGCALFSAASFAKDDPHSGTWKLNSAKSKYSPGPAPKSMTLVIQVDETGVKLEGNGADAEGKPMQVNYDAKFDGKDYPAKVPDGDAVVVKRIDANTLETIQKKGGKVTVTVASKVSADGKTRTSTFSGKNSEGKAVHNVAVYERQ
jgi:hypothetical protein